MRTGDGLDSLDWAQGEEPAVTQATGKRAASLRVVNATRATPTPADRPLHPQDERLTQGTRLLLSPWRYRCCWKKA